MTLGEHSLAGQPATPLPTHGGDTRMSLSDLSDLLTQERADLEHLMFRVETQQLILTGGRSRWLATAGREVEEAVERAAQHERERSNVSAAVAVELGLAADAPLVAIAEAAPTPWDDVLRGHRDALVALARELSSINESNRELLAMSYRATQETLLSLQESVRTYDDHGSAFGRPTDTAHLIDRTL